MSEAEYPQLSEESRKGWAIYEAELKAKLEPEHNGKVVAIHVESGDYQVHTHWALARHALRQRHPNGWIFSRFIGPPTPAENALGEQFATGQPKR